MTENKANVAVQLYARVICAAEGRIVGMSVQKVWWGSLFPAFSIMQYLPMPSLLKRKTIQPYLIIRIDIGRDQEGIFTGLCYKWTDISKRMERK